MQLLRVSVCQHLLKRNLVFHRVASPCLLIRFAHTVRLGAAITSIPALTRALAPGLRRGQGKVIFVCAGAPADAPAEDLAYRAALADLAPLMQTEMGAPLAINALRLQSGDPMLPKSRRCASAAFAGGDVS
ncbi:hypothetical protein ROG8370_00600 [Roseovarius gaetbuli]|uniref:Short chain dehydrogenase n=1 Tax=Roseovarius gaetbuli TaxID=1356575 RepID=A0A1X6YE61_9RHOB|nr:hypothetical protein ROG8370_00600 [Roseovarius gaetbuli]